MAAVILAASILLRRPLVGVLWSGMQGAGMWWRHDRPSLRRYDIATGVLAAVFAARFAVLHQLYEDVAVPLVGEHAARRRRHRRGIGAPPSFGYVVRDHEAGPVRDRAGDAAWRKPPPEPDGLWVRHT